MTDIQNVKGIGAVSADWLREANIHSREELEAVGAVDAFRRVQALGVHPTKTLLWVLQAGLMDLHWTQLSQEIKQQLEHQLRQGVHTQQKDDSESD